MRRVVVTGLGAVTPLGNGVKTSWKRLLEAKSGARLIRKFDTTDLAVRYGCEVQEGLNEGEFDFQTVINPKERRKLDDFIVFGIAAAEEAINDSGWKPETEEAFFRTGVTIGSGVGGLSTIEENAIKFQDDSRRRLSPFELPGALINLLSGHVSIRHGFQGPNFAVVTACSTGAHCIGDAARLIANDEVDVMVAGGAEAAMCRVSIASFSAARALSTKFHNDPERASRPYDKDRDGFVMGEGAGVIILEEYEHAKKRGAHIYGELSGFGFTADAFHITAPASDGRGAYRSMKMALARAKLSPEDVLYINAHGTSTPLGDTVEVEAVKRLYNGSSHKVAMSSTKSATGHLLGAAGGVEAIFSLKALAEDVIPPTLNLDNPSDGLDINLVPKYALERKLSAVMTNSFGFGGTNASLIFSAV